MLLHCNACDVDKPEEEFSWRYEGKKRQTRCRLCMNEYNKKHYESNKKYYVQKARESKKEMRNLIIDTKTDQPCADCKVTYPYYVLDFDHLPGSDKAFTIGESVKRVGKRQMIDEIAKCDIVCANCHRIRTFNRQST